ncbi:MAG: MerR family transcriptional regulator [Bacteroidia bacterium]|nr:MerR family transcriptional regulator [Bacteroidia bacterium]
MGNYSIKDLEQLSGIKAHTLRIWEQRYGILEPKRTITNIRYYDDEDLKQILNVSYLNRNGLKISKIASLSASEIHNRVKSVSDTSPEFPNQIDALTIAMINLEEDRFDKIISTNTLQYGFEQTMLDIVYPFLSRIGILWQTGSIHPAHEHFISNLIRQKMIVAIDGQVSRASVSTVKKYALFLPDGELHELSLLFSAYIIKSRGQKVIYLGQSLPMEDLDMICDKYNPDYLLSVITTIPANDQVVTFARDLRRRFPDKGILLAGFQATYRKAEMPRDITIMDSLHDLIEFVEKSGKSFNAKTA